jgi:CubicO group peptidase (beta-lactamase class C family)
MLLAAPEPLRYAWSETEGGAVFAACCRRDVRAAAVRWSGTILVAASMLAGCGRAPVEPGAPLDAFADHVDVRVATAMERYQVPGVAVALVRDGEVAWTQAYGFADLEGAQSMTLDALFHTGSISKSVTAWGVLRLVEQGRVGLDDPVARYVPDLRIEGEAPLNPEITVRRALSHTSGAWFGALGSEYPVDGFVPPAIEALERDLRFITPPGATFRYSNHGFDLLELVVERASGRPFADWMRDEVLVPLGMHDASFAWRDATSGRVPMGYDLDGRPIAPFVYATKASGGLFATVGDVARFVAASVRPGDGAVLSGSALRELHTPVVAIPGAFGLVADGYGLGHFVEQVGDDLTAVWHGGQGHGWMTHVHAVPELGAGIVVLTNSQRSWPLISMLVGDWARWTGVGTVKVGRITYGVAGVRILAFAMLLAALGLAARIVLGAGARRLRFAPLDRAARLRRAGQAVVGLAGIAAIGWSAAQPYLLVTSVFPGVIEQAAWSALLLSLTLVAAAGFVPRTRVRRRRRRRLGPMPGG